MVVFWEQKTPKPSPSKNPLWKFLVMVLVLHPPRAHPASASSVHGKHPCGDDLQGFVCSGRRHRSGPVPKNMRRLAKMDHSWILVSWFQPPQSFGPLWFDLITLGWAGKEKPRHRGLGFSYIKTHIGGLYIGATRPHFPPDRSGEPWLYKLSCMNVYYNMI